MKCGKVVSVFTASMNCLTTVEGQSLKNENKNRSSHTYLFSYY